MLELPHPQQSGGDGPQGRQHEESIFAVLVSQALTSARALLAVIPSRRGLAWERLPWGRVTTGRASTERAGLRHWVDPPPPCTECLQDICQFIMGALGANTCGKTSRDGRKEPRGAGIGPHEGLGQPHGALWSWDGLSESPGVGVTGPPVSVPPSPMSRGMRYP